MVPRRDRWWNERVDGLSKHDRDVGQPLATDLDALALAHHEPKWIRRDWGIYHAAYAKYDRWQAVSKAFTTALEKIPDDRESLRGRARARSELGNWEKVVQDCDLALRQDPNGWDLWYLRGRAHEKLAKLSEAASDYREALDRGGAGPEVKGRLAEMSRRLDRASEALPVVCRGPDASGR